MKILIAGANGKIGRHLVRGLAKSDHICRAMVRDPAQEWELRQLGADEVVVACLLYTSPSPRDGLLSRMPSSA